MNKLLYLATRNKENTLNFILWISYSVFSLLFFLNGYMGVGWFCLAATLAFIILHLLNNFLPEFFFYGFLAAELIVYNIFVTLGFGNDCGTLIFIIILNTATFLSCYDKDPPRLYYKIIGLASLLVSIFDVLWPFRQDANLQILNQNHFMNFFYIYNIGISAFILVFLSITAEANMRAIRINRQKQIKQLIYNATHDELTDLPNRRKAMELLHIYESEHTIKKFNYSLSIFDIDKFKQFNDTYGHNCGDYMISSLTDFIREILPQNFFFARWGGEEFIIIVPMALEVLVRTLEKVRSAVEQKEFIYKKQPLSITITFGASSSDLNATLDSLLIDADNNLFWGKQHGRNQVVDPGRINKRNG